MNSSVHVDLPVGNEGIKGACCFASHGGEEGLRDPRRGASRALLALTVTLAALTWASCGKKKAAASVPPPPVVVTEPEPAKGPAAPVSEPQTTATLPPPQPIPADAIPEFVGPLAADPSSAPPPGADEPQPVPSTSPARSAETAAPAGPAEGQGAVPQLGRILSAEERQAYDEMIDRSIESARRSLMIVLKHPLSPDQHTAVRRIRAFIEQADATRAQDLALAKNLADRAQLLAADLARSIP